MNLCVVVNALGRWQITNFFFFPPEWAKLYLLKNHTDIAERHLELTWWSLSRTGLPTLLRKIHLLGTLTQLNVRSKENRGQQSFVALNVTKLLRMHSDAYKKEMHYHTSKFCPVPSGDIHQHCSGNPHIKSHYSCNSGFKTICSKNSTIHQLLSTSFIKTQTF